MSGLVTAPAEDPCDASACAVSALANTRAVETTTRVDVMNSRFLPAGAGRCGTEFREQKMRVSRRAKTCFDMQKPQAACRIGDVNARHSSFSITFCEAFASTDFAIAYIVWAS